MNFEFYCSICKDILRNSLQKICDKCRREYAHLNKVRNRERLWGE